MPNYDIFNGDADGICSLIQLRLAEPCDSILVTGVKRDIELLSRITPEKGDEITALDISMELNQAALKGALEAGAKVFYADHHRSGDIPVHPALTAHINTAPNTCTGLIVDHLLGGKYRHWAIVAAYGDNITQVADEYAIKQGMSSPQQALLKQLGIAINYNSYGRSIDDLHYDPAELYRIASLHKSPFDFIHNHPTVFRRLTEGFKEDLEKGLAVPPSHENGAAAIVCMPNEPWARRITGVLGNELANRHPDRAHAVVTYTINSNMLQASIRAPKSNATGADESAKRFGGGGRKIAAGIKAMEARQIEELWRVLIQTYDKG